MWSPIDTSFFNEKNTPSFFIILPKTRERLREKLGPAAKYLDTVRGVGYRFAED